MIKQKFLTAVYTDISLSEISTFDSLAYRFRNEYEQRIINGLMLKDQKQRAHLAIAKYYENLTERGMYISNEEDSTNITSVTSSIPQTNWEILHLIALHLDMGNATLPAMLNYFKTGNELARLGLRDNSHTNLSAAYLLMMKLLQNQSAQQFDESEVKRDVIKQQQLAKMMVGKIVEELELPEWMKFINQDHLRTIFVGDIDALTTSIIMLIKFGQSVTTLEKEGYKLATEIYIHAIYLSLLIVKEDVFRSMLDTLHHFIASGHNEDWDSLSQSSDNYSFCIEDLTVCFPAFSGLLTIYRDTPIVSDAEQEKFLANLFVAITKEANEDVHLLRTKCILAHLHLKHGNNSDGLRESEEVKEIYNHNEHSLKLSLLYGMDWPLICVSTMTSIYIFQGNFSLALENIAFISKCIPTLDEFVSSTKATLQVLLSSCCILLQDIDQSVKLSEGLSNRTYSYFYRPSAILIEKIAKMSQHIGVMLEKNLSTKMNIVEEDDIDKDVLSILDSQSFHTINHTRPYLHASIEALSDRGIEAFNAAICVMRIIELMHCEIDEDILLKCLNYCQAGLAHLNQSIHQRNSQSHEKILNYFNCLYDKALLLCWHHKILCMSNESNLDVTDVFDFGGNELELAKSALSECKDLGVRYNYPLMLLFVGSRLIDLDLDKKRGKALITKTMIELQISTSKKDYKYATEWMKKMSTRAEATSPEKYSCINSHQNPLLSSFCFQCFYWN